MNIFGNVFYNKHRLHSALEYV